VSKRDLFTLDAHFWSINLLLRVGDALHVSGLEGQVHRLDSEGKRWQIASAMETPRFFHQLLPYDASSLIAVAGASRNGHVAHLEKLSVIAQ